MPLRLAILVGFVLVCMRSDAEAPSGPAQTSCAKHANDLVTEGVALLGKADWKKAEAKFNESIKICRKNPPAIVNRSLIYSIQGKHAAAVKGVEEAIKMEPALAGSLASVLSSAYTQKGRAATEKGDTKGALADLKKAVAVDPSNAMAYSELAFLAIKQKKFDSCIGLATAAIKANEKLHEGWANRGACLFAKGDLPAALKDVDAALRIKKTAEALTQKAVIHASLKQCPEAERNVAEAVAIDARLEPVRAEILGMCAKKAQ